MWTLNVAVLKESGGGGGTNSWVVRMCSVSVLIFLLAYVIVVFLDDRLVESDGFFVFVLLHEEHVRYVQLPRVVLVAELHRLAENLLHHDVVLTVPVNLSLRHHQGDVSVMKKQKNHVHIGAQEIATIQFFVLTQE